MNISIVIPNWNGKELLAKNFASVMEAKKNKANKILEVIVVDNGSSDDSIKYLKDTYDDEVRIIAHKVNRGFATAVNTGARMARGELICLLNNDVLPEKDFLVSVQKLFEEKKVFAVSLHEKGYGGAKAMFTDGFIGHQGLAESPTVRESFWANGGSGVFRRSVWMELKGMDDDLLSPFYWEDIDLCYRAQKRGYSILWDPKARVVHEHESSMKKLNPKYVQRIRERNQLLFIWKNLTSKNLFRKHRKFLIRRIIRHPGYLRIVVMALRKLSKVKRLRKIEMRESSVSDEAIFARFN